MLTMFHANEFKTKLNACKLESAVKQSMENQVDEFLAKLFEVADFDPESVSGEKRDSFHSQVKIVREKAYAFNFARA